MSNTYTKGYADGASLTETQLDTAYQTLQLDVANTALMTTGSTTGQGLLSNGSGVAASFQTIPDPMGPFALRNYGLKATAASGVITVSLKTKAGATPSGSDIVDFNYSTNGTTSATYTSVQIQTATTFTINSSASLGYTATSTARIFVYGYYNTVTSSVKMAVSARSDFDNGGAVTLTAMSAAADSKMSLYASAALTVVPRLLGFVEMAHNSAGAWQTPTKVNITNQAAGQRGIAISSASSGLFSTNNTASVAVTNMSVSLTTTGRPVFLSVIPDGTTNTSYLQSEGTSVSAFQFFRGTSALSVTILRGNATGTTDITVPVSALSLIDIPAAGTYTYTLHVYNTSGVSNHVVVSRAKLMAYEL